MLSAAYQFTLYYGTLGAFAVAALGLNVFFWIRFRPETNPATERFVRLCIHGLFRQVIRWASFAGLATFEFRGFEPAPVGGVVMVANHPGLLDAVYFLAHLPNAICVFKPSIRRNPLFGPGAVRAGYLAANHHLTLVREAAAKVRAGATLVVFPEGTRTPANRTIGPFKPGFALMARCANAPVQLVRISVTAGVFTKDAGWWKVPPLPAHVVLQAGPRLDPALAPSLDAFVAQVEAWYRDAGTSPTAAPLETGPSVTPTPA